jgi:hypothetical protein
MSDGGTRPRLCSLPPDGGSCDALFWRYHYDPATDRCLLFQYGGCDGNENNFESASACEAACEPGEPAPAACQVNGNRYPHGASNVDDPTSCNTCSCEDGELTVCTDAECPTEPCATGTQLATSCAVCGPGDGCEVRRTDCHPACEDHTDCDEGTCVEGACVVLCP